MAKAKHFRILSRLWTCTAFQYYLKCYGLVNAACEIWWVSLLSFSSLFPSGLIKPWTSKKLPLGAFCCHTQRAAYWEVKPLLHCGAQCTPDKSSHLSRSSAPHWGELHLYLPIYKHSNVLYLATAFLVCPRVIKNNKGSLRLLHDRKPHTDTKRHRNQFPVILECRNSRKR